MFEPRSPAELLEHYREVRQRLTDVSTPAPAPPKFRPITRRSLPGVVPPYTRQSVYLRGEWMAGPPGSWLFEPALKLIRKTVCRHYGVSILDFVSNRRTHDLVRPRHIFSYLAKKLTTHSFVRIGRFQGGRDHTTILHGFNKIACALATDAQLAADVAAIRKILEGA